MKLIKWIVRLLKKMRPRYQLSLDSHFYSLDKKSTIYRFKVFGEHTFPKFTFEDIKNNTRIMYDINPVDLMNIAIDDYIAYQKKSMLKISEILRDNRYKLSDNITEEIFSGDEICDNILLIEKIKNIDLYKIAYNTGFNHGRQLGKELTRKININNSIKNIIPFKSIDGDK